MIEQFYFLRLNSTTDIKPLDCASSKLPNIRELQEDLNHFLLDDAKDHLKELLAVTYIIEDNDKTIAYFSVLNDSIREIDTTRSRYKIILKLIPSPLRKRYKSHPAVKVGRFAVHKEYQGQGIGRELMDYIKGYFLDNNKTGCRFITVDAINSEETIHFYKNNGFEFLTTKDSDDDHRLMFFDLIKYTS